MADFNLTLTDTATVSDQHLLRAYVVTISHPVAAVIVADAATTLTVREQDE